VTITPGSPQTIIIIIINVFTEATA